MELSQIFTTGELGYYIFRIPALLATPQGTLLAFCAARRGTGDDWDPIDTVMRRSTDGGDTWGPITVLASDAPNTVDNPTPIYDRETGSIHLLYQINYARVYSIRSDDEGETWSQPQDLTPTFEQFWSDYPWRVIAPGPGHSIQLRNGRLLVAVWLSTGENNNFGPGKLGHRPSCVATIYSDDHGATWQRGDIVVNHSDEFPNPSETVPLELTDGRVALFIRCESPMLRRAYAVSPDGAHNWSQPILHKELYEAVCMASCIAMDLPSGEHVVLYSHPDSSAKPKANGARFGARENLTIRLSYDDGKTWPIARSLDPSFSGYSDLAVLPNGTICCLYEGGSIEGDMFRNTHLTLARFGIDWVSS